jgi:hypothetical protein
MRHVRLAFVGWAAIAGIAFLIVTLAVPGDRRIEVHVFVLAIGAILMRAAISAIAGAVPHGRRSELTRALDAKPPAPREVDDLERMTRIVKLGAGNAYELHSRLLPLLRDIAATRLERAGRRPGPDTLGRWWELLRPDREPPADRFGPGLPESELRALVADLENL